MDEERIMQFVVIFPNWISALSFTWYFGLTLIEGHLYSYRFFPGTVGRRKPRLGNSHQNRGGSSGSELLITVKHCVWYMHCVTTEHDVLYW